MRRYTELWWDNPDTDPGAVSRSRRPPQAGHAVLQAGPGQPRTVGIEGIRLHDVRAGRQVRGMQVADEIRPGQVESGQGPVKRFAAPGERATLPVTMAADSVHTIVVLDDSSGLKVDAVTDAVGSRIMPADAISAGFGGTAPRPPGNAAPWLVIIAAGALLTAAGLIRLRRPA